MKSTTFAMMLSWIVVCGVQAESPDPSLNFWPRWRGPIDTGVAPYGDPPTEWSESKNIRWKVEIPGHGLSTPVIWADHVYVLTAVAAGSGNATATPKPDERPRGRRGRRPAKPDHEYAFRILAVERATGKTVWERTARQELPHEGHHNDASLASASPVTDGKHVYAFFGSRGLYCFDMNGKPQWDVDLGDMTTRRGFGEGSSPALHGDTIVVNWDHEGDSFIVALDKRTGTQRWRKDRDEVTSWSTPIMVESANRVQVVVSATNRVRGYDLASGTVLWECGGQTTNTIPSPVFADGLLYATSGFRGNTLQAIVLGEARGDITGSSAVAWSYDEDTPYVPSPLLTGHTLYFLKHNRAILSCLDARTGKIHYARQRLEGLDGAYASPVAAAGRVYIAGRNGATVVLKQGPSYEVLATNTLDDGFDASPAIAGRELYLRGRKYLYCIAPK